MSHNLNFNKLTGKYAFMSVMEPAWHGLGTVVSEYPTSAEAIQLAGLDYEVNKLPMFSTVSQLEFGESGLTYEDKQLLVPDFFSTIRTDTNEILGVVGKDYQVVQNLEAFEFFDNIVNGGYGVKYETAGALGKGGRIFITATLPNNIVVGKDDETKQYLFLTTSHDGSGSITVAYTPTRIVCANTLNAAMRNMSNTVKIRHTKGATNRLNQAMKVLGLTSKVSGNMGQLFNRMADIQVTDKEVRQLIEMAMAPNQETIANIKMGKDDLLTTAFKNTCDEVYAYAMSHPTQTMSTTEGTIYGVYNAVTGYYQNVKKYADGISKTNSILEGTAFKRAQNIFTLCECIAATGSVDAVLS